MIAPSPSAAALLEQSEAWRDSSWCDSNWCGFAAQAASHRIWPRRAPSTLESWLDALPDHRIPEGAVIVCAADPLAAIGRAFGEIPGSVGARLWQEDVAALASWFGRFTESAFVRVRLDRVADNGCARFHQDNVRVRALCTYIGPGSQYVGAPDAAQALDEQTDYRGPLHTMPRFALGLFKGRRGAGAHAAVHRSPPIEDMGIVRSVLCLDEADEAER